MIDTDLLVASALGELSDDADAEVEQHVLSCGRCARAYAAYVRLGPAIAALVRAGAAMMPITRTLAERLEAEGLISRRYALHHGAVVPCTIGPEDLYSLTTYHADFSGVSRVDVIRGSQRIPDIPFDARVGQAYMLARADVLRKLPSMKLPISLVAVEDGGERTIAEYVLDHTAFAG